MLGDHRSGGVGLLGPRQEWDSLGAAAQVSCRPDAAASSPTDSRYYFCSCPAEAARLQAATRSHSGIENSLHWVLNVAYDEDLSRVKTGHAALNPAVIRYLTLNLL